MAPENASPRTGISGFLSVLAVMLSAVLVAKRMRWSSVTKRLISAA